jgi:hypothetical protein
MFGVGVAPNTTTLNTYGAFPVKMRATPSFSYSGSWQCSEGNAAYAITNLVGAGLSTMQGGVQATTSGLTQFRGYFIYTVNSSARAFFSVEL